jgi:hypothetical protein
MDVNTKARTRPRRVDEKISSDFHIFSRFNRLQDLSAQFSLER